MFKFSMSINVHIIYVTYAYFINKFFTMQGMHSDCNILKATSSEAYSLYDIVPAYDMNKMIRYQLMVLSRRGDSPVFQ